MAKKGKILVLQPKKTLREEKGGASSLEKAVNAEGYVDGEDLFGYEEEYERARAAIDKKRRRKKKAAEAAPLKKPEKVRKNRKGLKKALFAVALVVLVGLGGAMGYYVFQERLRETMETALEIDTFYAGITVDGKDVSGMTLAEAQNAWTEDATALAEGFRATLVADGEEFLIDAERARLTFNAPDVLEEAFSVNREGNLMSRYSNLQILLDEGRKYYTSMTYDLAPVREELIAFCESFAKEPENAYLLRFNFAEKQFIFKEEKSGRVPETIAAVNQTIAQLEAGEYGETVELSFQEKPAAVTREWLIAHTGLRASYTTETTDNDDRNTNIRLAAEAVNGTVLQPGETFSFNASTGKRSVEKGYKEAGAINNGVMVQEPGGGVCQVSSTLFNAVARADLAITDRHPHSWPSSYVPLGEDAAVDYPSTDFQFTNDTDMPIYLCMQYEDRVLTAEIYGLLLEDGISIALETEHNGYREPSSPDVRVNASLAEGKIRTIREERIGQSATTYKVYYKGEEEIGREQLHRSSYRAIQGIYEMGPNTTFKKPK